MSLTGVGLILAVPIWIWLIYDAYKPPGGGDAVPSGRVEPREDAEEPAEVVDYVLGWYMDHGGDEEDVEDVRARLGRVGVGRLRAGEVEFALEAIDAYDDAAGDIETGGARQALADRLAATR